MQTTTEQAAAGQAVYSSRTLSIYDLVVLSISNRWLWKCPTAKLLQHYNNHVTANHLDVGVGSGYFLDHCQFPASPRLVLMDMNNNSLGYARQRVMRYLPLCYQQNILQAITHDIDKFDSIAINYLLHCLPGTLSSKSIIFDHLKTLMKPNATLFGSTLLQGNVPRNACAQKLMNIYNRKGIFSNQQDNLEDLQAGLAAHFGDVQIKITSCVALFSARLVT